MKALVTGATGFVGGHLVERLAAEGHTVRALARRTSDVSLLRALDVEIVYGDVTDAASLEAAAAGCETVFHTAAVVSGWGHWEDFYRVGVFGTQNALNAAAAVGARRFVHLSSIAVYGSRVDGRVLQEAAAYAYRPETWNHYVREKVQSERLVFQAHARGAVAATAIRPPLIWGSRDRTAFPTALALLGSPLAALIGRGDNRLPCVGVRDVVDVCLRAALEPAAAGRAYNVASEQQFTQRQLFALLAGATGSRPPRRHVPLRVAYALGAALERAYTLTRRRSAPPLTRLNALLIASDVRLDCALARSELGWRQAQSVPDAIAEAAAFAAGRQAQTRALPV